MNLCFVAGETDLQMHLLPERRQNRRYNIALGLRFKTFESRNTVRFGTGQTINISSRGLLFTTTDMPLTTGCNLELLVRWPALYDNRLVNELYLRGRAIRAEERGIAVKVTRAAFYRVLTAADEDQTAPFEPDPLFKP